MRLRRLLSILLLPGVVLLALPGLILSQTGAFPLAWSDPFPWRPAQALLGAGLILAGLFLLARTAALFGSVGQGTLAPWDPPRKLVVRGVYRHVRNPMISGVLGVLLGEGLLFGSAPLLVMFALAALLNLVYIPLVEEPGLVRRFGPDYEAYRRNVPRWIPRRTAWRG